MAPNGDSRPPQTLRQAKAAFRKSNRVPQLSEQELRIIRRRAELEERAAKLREKEKRRLANKKKREEKAKAERQVQPKRAGSATIGGEVVNRQTERCDVLDKFVSRKRTCSEVLPVGKEELDRPCKAVKLSQEPVVSSSVVAEPAAKESSPAKQLGTTGRIPSKSPGPCVTPRAVAVITTTKVLTPRNPNIITPLPRSESAVVTTTSHELLCIDDWQDAVISSSQLEREMANPTQLAAKPANAVTSKDPVSASATPKSPQGLVCLGGRAKDELLTIPPISTQDMVLTEQDLEEIMGPGCRGGRVDATTAGLRRDSDRVWNRATKRGITSVAPMGIHQDRQTTSRKDVSPGQHRGESDVISWNREGCAVDAKATGGPLAQPAHAISRVPEHPTEDGEGGGGRVSNEKDPGEHRVQESRSGKEGKGPKAVTEKAGFESNQTRVPPKTTGTVITGEKENEDHQKDATDPPSSYGFSRIDDELLLQLPLDG